MTIIKKRSRTPAQPVNKNGRTKECLCGCGKTFVVDPAGVKKFHSTKCRYRYYKQTALDGRKMPDYYVKCVICGEWFPCWKIWTGNTFPLKCKKESCKKTERDNHLIISNVHGTLWPAGIRVPDKWSLKIALIARVTYCTNGPDGKSDQCGDYGDCLAKGDHKGGKIFEPFFVTKKNCYKTPDKKQTLLSAINYKKFYMNVVK